MRSSVKYHSTGTKNQFKFDGKRGVTACVPFCIQALYHLYEKLHYEGQLLEPKDWHLIMERGIRIWELWRKAYPTLDTPFPNVHEIIKMKECAGFYKLFEQKHEECGGFIQSQERITDQVSSLDRFIVSLAKQSKIACAIITLNINFTLALLSYGNSLFLFDPHGYKGSDESLLAQFSNPKEVTPFLMAKYDIDETPDLPKLKKYYTETEIQSFIGYSATLFTVK